MAFVRSLSANADLNLIMSGCVFSLIYKLILSSRDLTFYPITPSHVLDQEILNVKPDNMRM